MVESGEDDETKTETSMPKRDFVVIHSDEPVSLVNP
jgi:hypothetical protein